jgi:Mrp family chromosome partitioning ATPase
MVNTRILEQQLGWRRGQGRAGAIEGPRDLRHEPLLQGRIQAGGLGTVSAVAGLAPRGRLSRAAVADTWASLDSFGDRLEALGARHGAVPAFDRDSPAGTTLDQLRSALLRATAQHGWRRIGITAPRRGAGASFVALGLAASVARLDYLRILLVDLDLSRPSLHRHLGLSAAGPLEPVLRGHHPALARTGRVGNNLALVLNGMPCATAADLLPRPEAILALRALDEALAPDLMLLDLPPLLTDPAAGAALAQVEAVLVVVDGTRTTAREVSDCERRIEGQVPILGFALNKSEDRPGPATPG